MKSRIAMVFCLIVGGASLLYAHDLFLKLDSYFLHPNTPLTISVLNGTFTSTEGPLVAGRITDISLVSPDGITSQLLDRESIERYVRVDGVDHPVAIHPGVVAQSVTEVAIAVGVAREVQPVTSAS